MYQFRVKQQLPITIEEAWEFFSSPSNLQIITPAYMGFTITGGYTLGEKMFEGMRISYKVKPVLGIPLKWVTLITKVDEPFCFTDKQLKGPYASWRHQHFFKEIPGGIEMEDVVNYQIPFGKLGELANALLVRRQLKGIFDYRFKVLQERFGKIKTEVV